MTRYDKFGFPPTDNRQARGAGGRVLVTSHGGSPRSRVVQRGKMVPMRALTRKKSAGIPRVRLKHTRTVVSIAQAQAAV